MRGPAAARRRVHDSGVTLASAAQRVVVRASRHALGHGSDGARGRGRHRFRTDVRRALARVDCHRADDQWRSMALPGQAEGGYDLQGALEWRPKSGGDGWRTTRGVVPPNRTPNVRHTRFRRAIVRPPRRPVQRLRRPNAG
jgi:hypothetical protein